MPVPKEGKGKRNVNRSSIPWFKDFTPCREYATILDEEMDAFSSFTVPTASTAPRPEQELLVALNGILQNALPGCMACLSGAAAAGVLIDSVDSEMSLVNVSASHLPYIAECLMQKGYGVDVRTSSLKVHYSDDNSAPGAVVYLSDANVMPRVRVLQRRVNMNTHIAKCVRVLVQVFKQSNLLGTDTGLSQLAVVVMVVAALRHGGTNTTPSSNSTALLETIALYAQNIDNRSTMVTLDGLCPSSSLLGMHDFWVADPLDASRNLAHGCTRFIQIREVLRHCLMMLQKWETSDLGGGKGRKPYMYKGKSPLSSIIAFKKPSTPSQSQLNLPPRQRVCTSPVRPSQHVSLHQADKACPEAPADAPPLPDAADDEEKSQPPPLSSPADDTLSLLSPPLSPTQQVSATRGSELKNVDWIAGAQQAVETAPVPNAVFAGGLSMFLASSAWSPVQQASKSQW